MNKIYYILVIMLALSSVSCDSNFITSQNSSSKANTDEANQNQLDAGITNQAPKISCTLKNTNNSLQVRQINTIDELDTFFSSYPVEGQSIAFDCSQSQDESASTLSFYIDTDYDPALPSWQPLNQPIVLSPGRKSMAVKAVDQGGLQTIKTFSIDSQCANGTQPVINATAVTIANASKHNYYNYSAAGAVTGGTDFQYAWDFNGDSVFDSFPMTASNNSIWLDSSTANNVYSIFASAGSHQHKAFLRVRNGCNLESDTVEINMPNELPNIARTLEAQAEKKPYYYLQADINGLGTQATELNMFQRVNGPYLATQYPDDSYHRVVCSYDFTKISDKARFSIQGYNWYEGTTRANSDDQFLQGMEIRISSIPDNGGQTTQTYNQSNGVKLDSALYKVSAASDGIVSENYDHINTNCAVEITIERSQSVTPCAMNTNQVEFKPTTVTILLGEFNCPKLTDSRTNKSVAANNGKFYCEVAPQDQCVGGGGGGGGTPPLEQ